MIKYCLITIILVSCFQLSFGQEGQDSIIITKAWWGYRVPRYHDKKISGFHPFKDYRKIMQYDPEATRYLRRSKRFMIAGLVVEEAGLLAFLIYESNRLPVNSNNPDIFGPDVIPFAVGIGLITSPFLFHSGKNLQQAINTYNHNLHKTGLRSIKPEYYFTLKGNAIGLAIQF